MSREHQEHEHDRDHEQDEARQKPQPKIGYPKRTGADKVFKKGSEKTARRVAQLIAIVDRHAILLTNRMNANEVRADEVDHMKRNIEEERTTLLTLIGGLASTDPLVARAMTATDRLNIVIERLEALQRAHQSKDATAAVRVEGNSEELLDAGKKRARVGYCDVARQGVAPCQYDETTRQDLRAQVKEAVGFAHTNWKAALTTLHLEAKLTPVPPSLVQKLGEALLGVLFGAIGSGIKALAMKGIDKAAAGLASEVYDDATMVSWTEAPDPAAIGLVKKGVEHAVAGGTSLAKEKFKKSMSAVQLADGAVAATRVPADKVGLLAAMKSEPEKWATNIIGNLHNLFDEDLAGLAVALPITSPAITEAAFTEKLNDVVHRFEQQVLAVDTAPGTNIRPIQIHWNGKSRHALAAPEKAPNKNMHGEWKHVPVKTGKWTFVRWLDDDMRGMAQARVHEQEGPWAASAFMAMANDAEFWDNKTLELLAQESAR